MKMTIVNYNEAEGTYHLHEMLPIDCIKECSSSGDNWEACDKWVKALGLNIPRQLCIKELEETGAWNLKELAALDDHELNIKFLWIAVGYGE